MRRDDIGSLQVAEETVLIRIFVIAIATLYRGVSKEAE
jgi:hypothetical protein